MLACVRLCQASAGVAIKRAAATTKQAIETDASSDKHTPSLRPQSNYALAGFLEAKSFFSFPCPSSEPSPASLAPLLPLPAGFRRKRAMLERIHYFPDSARRAHRASLM